jgi:hypothetical protein
MRWLCSAVAAVALGCGSNGGTERAAVAEPAAVSARRPIDVVRDLVTRAIALADATDAARGVVFVEYYTDPSEQDPRAGADGLIRAAARLCGSDLLARINSFRSDLARHADAVACQGLVCTYEAAAEYDLGATLTFAPGPVLESVVLIEGGPVTEEFTTEARAWARRELARLAKGSCR